MNKSQRISTVVGSNTDKHVKVKLEQNINTVEILSLKIDQKDLYQSFNCDYGVLIGRVIANGGVGIPNAKVSIFIPISEEDQQRPEINAIYPYTTPRDKNPDGKRYNLLPRVGRTQLDGTVKPLQPFGSFPIKEEIVTNETLLEVYKTYYKYSTVTNNSGDYMLFGVPTGVQTVHLSVDITDIGRFSMSPAAMVTNLGYSPNLFTDNNTKIKPSNDLADLPHIETQEISVDVIPFCGDSENFDIGITRQDFRIRAILVNTIIVFGSTIVDGEQSVWSRGDGGGSGSVEVEEFHHINDAINGNLSLSISAKRIGLDFVETIFYYPSRVTDAVIDNLATPIDAENDIFVLEKTEYSRYIEDGQFAYILNCNRKKIITDEFGNDVIVSDNSVEGIFSEFRGFFTFDFPNNDELPINPSGEIGNRPIRSVRNRMKVPQSAEDGEAFTRNTSNATELRNNNWRRENFTFVGGNIYSVAKYHQLSFQKDHDDSATDNIQKDRFYNTGLIISKDTNGFENNSFEFPTNGTNAGDGSFGAQWLNFCLHFPQNGYTNRDSGSRRTNNWWTTVEDRDYYTSKNNQLIASYVKDSSRYLRNDRHQTKIILVPKEDLVNIVNDLGTQKGFKDNEVTSGLIGNYKNGVTTGKGGRIGGTPSNPVDPRFYFYRGFDTADCIEFLFRLGIV